MQRIIIKNLSKKFSISCSKDLTTRDLVKRMLLGKKLKKDFWALKNLSFSVNS